MEAAGKKARRYNSPERAERSNRTRLAILAAAQLVFRERGYVAGTIRAIAEQAGVAVPTVYLYFRSKAELVRAMADEVTEASDLSVERVLAGSDPARRLQIGAAILRMLHERAEVVTDVLRIASGTDVEIERVWRGWQERHLHAVALVVRALASDGALRPGLGEEEATDALYAVGGADVYRLLVRDRGWATDAYEDWLADTGRRILMTGESG